MTSFCVSLMFSMTVLASLTTHAQSTVAESKNAQPEVVVSKLSPPLYPGIARAARISGDVEVKLGIRRDGSIESAVVVSGPALLTLPALDSAKQSKFECRGCRDSGATQSLTYSFRQSPEKPDPCCCTSGKYDAANAVQVSGRHITITAPPPCICPDVCSEKLVEERSHFRSPKCLYLWKCGHREFATW